MTKRDAKAKAEKEANVTEQDVAEKLREVNPHLADVVEQRKKQRQIILNLDETKGIEGIEILCDQAKEIVFTDLVVAIGAYAGRKAENVRELKSMTDVARQGIVETASREFTRCHPLEHLMHVLEQSLPPELRKLMQNMPEDLDKCSSCEKDCPLAGKKTDDLNPGMFSDVVCIVKGPEGLQ